MWKIWFFTALIALPGVAPASVSKPSAPVATDSMATIHGKLAEAVKLQQSGDLVASMALLQEVLQSPAFVKLPPNEQQATLFLSGAINYERGEYKAAHEYLVKATEGPSPKLQAWQVRLDVAFRVRDYRDAARCVATIARQWPNELGSVSDHMLYAIKHELDVADASNEELVLLEALFDAHWSDQNGYSDIYWFELTRLLIEKGAIAKATIVAKSIHSARMAVAMRIDKRFDVVVQANKDAFDIDRMAAAEIQQAEMVSKEHPDKLAPLVHLQDLLNDKLQYQRVIAITDETAAKVAGGKGLELYSDYDGFYTWMLNRRSAALEGLGRWDEAATQLASAAQLSEDGHVNVSQVLNLANLDANLLRPQEAMDALKRLGEPSAFGRMQLEKVMLKIAVQKKDQAGIAEHMAYLRDNRDEAISSWQDALLMVGDEDAAADLLIERLHNPKWRNDALVEMQDYLDTPVSPFYRDIEKHWKNVIRRPKVREAVNEVGRIESFHLAS
jgi:tetratricopeptide (TPR) repeat protein